MQLLIVESPVKAKTISKFLGKGFQIESSFGHVRDLPSSVLGVDTEKDFQLKYVIPVKAKPKVKILKEAAKKAEDVILATDEDREGEAISWHLSEVLDLKAPQRIVFHEITKSAIEEALKHPRDIDMDLVDAQQARRALDRMVGYKLSPFLWKKLMRGLSAGRVQSVAVRLICDRENEICKFIPAEYWSIIASFLKEKTEFEANLIAKDNKTLDKLEIKNKQKADKILQDLENAEYKVINVDKKETKRNPLAPFTTSTLQQTAVAKLGYSAQRTMSIAQKLYEKGHITYHRTDSMNLSSISQSVAKNFIEKEFGKNYWPGYSRSFKTKSKSAQEAHEAIRPTFPDNTPENLKKGAKLLPDEFKLYDLIWKRFMASQMTEACFDSTSVDIESQSRNDESKSQNVEISKYLFRANGQVLKFDGFLKLYPLSFEEADLPILKTGEVLNLQKITPSQHFTQPPARYSEATLIKALEKDGIGRPSTYAPIITTIQTRNYVEKDENKKFKPTKTGVMVNELLVEHFPEIVDIGFTAEMEEKLDKVAEGKNKWSDTIKDFYLPFEKNLKEKEQSVAKKDLTEPTDKICPDCQGAMIIRMGRFGKFYACSKFPNCKHTEPMPKPSLDIECPKCGQGQIVEKKSKRGKIFYGCANWPHCDFALWDKPNKEICRRCGALMVETKSKKIKCSNPECKKE